MSCTIGHTSAFITLLFNTWTSNRTIKNLEVLLFGGTVNCKKANKISIEATTKEFSFLYFPKELGEPLGHTSHTGTSFVLVFSLKSNVSVGAAN